MVGVDDELPDVDVPVFPGDVRDDHVQPGPSGRVASTNGDDRSLPPFDISVIVLTFQISTLTITR
jgi:hypothetical protein